ncbi:putative helicase senataxin, partial [Apostichopus japonicus]
IRYVELTQVESSMAERENSEEVEESTQGIVHATDDMIHWCSKCGSNFDHVSFFKKFSAGAMKEPVPDELLCLNRCWKCVQEYYQRRRKYLEGCELQTEGLLYTFECIVLMHFLKCLNNKRKAKRRSKDRAISSMSPPKDHAKIGLPIVVQQILQYPFSLHERNPSIIKKKKIDDLFIEILVDLLKEKKDYLNVSKFPGLYLLLIHPNEEIHSWAKGAVKNFCPIELQDSSDLLRAINLVLSVLKFNLQTDPILCDNLGLEEPSCRNNNVSSLQYERLLARVHREIPQTILNSLLQAAASEDPGGSAFLKKLSCFAVVLKSFKGEVWLQVHQTQELVFLSIIKCKVWLTVLDEMCSLVQHRLFHLQPNMEHYQSCKGPSECNFCHFKHRKKNQLVIEVEVPFLRNQENLATLMRITRNLFREKFLLGRSSSKGISIPKRVLPSQAGFLTYDQIVCMVASEQQGNLNQMIDFREESPRSLNTTKEKPNSSVATGNIDSKDDEGLSKMLEKIHKEKVSSTPRKHGPNSQMKFPPKGKKRRKMYPIPPKRTSDVKAGGQYSHNRLRTTIHLDKKGEISPRDAQRLGLRKCVVSIKKLLYPRKNELPQEGSNSIEEHEALLPPKKKAHPLPCDSDSTDCEMDTAQTYVMGDKDDEDLPGDMEVDPPERNTGRKESGSIAGNNSLASHDNDQQISDISSSQTDDRNDTVPNAILLNSGKHNKIMESDSDSEWDPPDVLNRDGVNRELYNREGTFSKTEPSQINKGQSSTLQEATERKVERKEMEGKENSVEEIGKVPRVKRSEPMDDFIEKKEALIRKIMGQEERSNDDREVSRPKSNETGHEDGRGKSTVDEAVKIKQEKFDDAEDNAHEILSSDDEDDDDILEIKVIHPFCYVVSTDDEDETEKKTAGQELEDKDKNQAMSTVSVERATTTSLGIRPSSPGEKQAQMTEEASMTSGNAPSAEVQKLANTEGEISPSKPVNETSHVEEHRQSRKEQRTITILNRKPQSPVHNNSVQSIGSEEYHSLAQTTKGKCDPSSCNACKDQKGKHRVPAPHEDSARRKRKMQHVVRKDDSDKDSVFMNNEVDSGADGDDEDVRVGLDKDEGKSSSEEENGDWEVENGDEEKSLPKDSEKAANASDTNDSLVDSDAETDDGSGLGEAHNMHSLDFLDEALMVNGWRREASKNVDDDVEDGESSDGLELSEIIDHTESLVWDVKEEKQEKGMEDEKNLIIKKDVKESNDGNVNRITEHRPSHHHAVSAPDINRVDVESESVMRDVSKTGKVDKGAGDSSSPQKGDKLLINILEGVGPDGDDDEDEEEGSDGWLEGDGEAEDENEEVFKDNSGWVPDDQENVSCSSQGFEVSNKNLRWMACVQKSRPVT